MCLCVRVCVFVCLCVCVLACVCVCECCEIKKNTTNILIFGLYFKGLIIIDSVKYSTVDDIK